jgi:hypothetical protein
LETDQADCGTTGQALKLSSKVIDARETSAAFSKRLQREHADQIVLVVGHSDTIPALIDAIAMRKVGITIADGDFANIFILL